MELSTRIVSLPSLPRTLPSTLLRSLTVMLSFPRSTLDVAADRRRIDDDRVKSFPPLTSTLTEELSTTIESLPRPPSTLFPTVLPS